MNWNLNDTSNPHLEQEYDSDRGVSLLLPVPDAAVIFEIWTKIQEKEPWMVKNIGTSNYGWRAASPSTQHQPWIALVHCEHQWCVFRSLWNLSWGLWSSCEITRPRLLQLSITRSRLTVGCSFEYKGPFSHYNDRWPYIRAEITQFNRHMLSVKPLSQKKKCDHYFFYLTSDP